MNRYTTYCTPEQTKKALELGAPIENHPMYKYDEDDSPKIVHNNEWNREVFSYCPTAEQMLGFLRSKGIKFLFSDEPDTEGCYWFIGNREESISCGKEKENKEFAAIDSALEYLSNQK